MKRLSLSFAAGASILATPFAHAAESTPQTGAADPTLFAARVLRPGEIVGASDLATTDGEALTEAKLASLAGREVKRTLYPGKPLNPGDLGPRTLVARNAIVAVEFVKGPLVITTEARALEDGAAGELIRVMNVDSRRTFAAQVFSDNRVRAK